jgi:type VI secretion system protein ImpL
MNRFLSSLFKPWLLSLCGVLLLALLVWFEGPLLAFDGHEPLASARARWYLIVVLLVLWGAVHAWKLLKARRANRLLMAGVAGEAAPTPGASESAAEVAALGERMRNAMGVLRKANPGWKMSGQYLYQLPWYLFVGAPGSGKTTALTRSGLQFPLTDALGPEAIGGIGGTRNCDWWFTDEAVLLDTAGRYTTQDSYTEVDRTAWSAFLDLLKKHRRRRPINGVIVALSVADLLQQGEAGRQAQAQAIRARIDELHDRLGLRFPVYVIVTKCDLLAGFAEFFEAFGREERAQVWGMTFPPPQDAAPGQGAAALAGFPAEFDALERQLQVRVLARMQQERDLQKRALLYSFPQQFAGIGDVLGRFLQTVFEPNRYQEPALLRGVYFTSGTQEGSPIDRVMASLAASFGLGRKVLPPGAPSGRSYFITRLMREVIFQEAGLAGVNRAVARRRRLIEWGAMAAAGVLVLLLALGLTVSHGRNRHLIAESSARTAEVAQLAQALNSQPAQGSALAALPLLNAARDLPAGYAQQDRSVALLDRMSLYQGDKLGAGAIRLYKRLLRSTLLPRIVANMEDALRRGDANNQDFLYETLRAYLMLGDRRHFDAASVSAWVDFEWRRTLPQASQAQRQQLDEHVAALFDNDEETAEPVRLDAGLIAQVRLTLATMPLPQRIYNRLKRDVAQGAQPLAEFSVNGALGRDGSTLFARQSGAPLSRGVSGVYSVAGYRRLVDASGAAVADVASDSWVLDRQESTAAVGGIEAIKAAVLQLYFADYIRQWDAFLADVRLVPLTSLDQGARVANALAGPDLPLRKLLQAAARATTLEGAAAESKGGGVDQFVRGRLDEAKRKLASTLGGEDAAAADVAAADSAAGNPVDQHFAALHKLAGAAPAPLDQVLTLMKDVALYFDAAENARRSGAPAPSGDALLRLKREGEGQPAPLAMLLQNIDSGGAGLALGSERARLNALWSAAAAPFCRDAIAGRYPLVRGSPRDATADDFGKFFGPGGLMDDFFTKNLASQVDMSGARWTWRTTGAAPLGIPQEVLNQFQRGARLRDMFFAAGGRQPSLHFDLRAVSADPSLTKVTLTIDGQPVQYQSDAAARATAILLPSGKGGGAVRVEAVPALRQELGGDGPWAWFHVMDKGQLAPDGQGERYRLTFDLDGRKIVYELNASSVINPFRRDAIEQFSCPTSL